MAECPLPHTYEITRTSDTPVDEATVSVPYPATRSGNLLLLSVVRGAPFNLIDATPTVTGWSNVGHYWGANNYLHNLYLRVADGTETGFVSIAHPDTRTTTAVMVCLKANVGSFDGSPVIGINDAPTLTPTNQPALLIYFAGVPNGVLANNYSAEGMCLLGGASGGVYIRSNQVYAEVVSTGATGTRSWPGEEFGAVAPWRGYAGGLVRWSLGGPTVGFIGSGTF